jgi:hypothetical protein
MKQRPSWWDKKGFSKLLEIQHLDENKDYESGKEDEKDEGDGDLIMPSLESRDTLNRDRVNNAPCSCDKLDCQHWKDRLNEIEAAHPTTENTNDIKEKGVIKLSDRELRYLRGFRRQAARSQIPGHKDGWRSWRFDAKRDCPTWGSIDLQRLQASVHVLRSNVPSPEFNFGADKWIMSCDTGVSTYCTIFCVNTGDLFRLGHGAWSVINRLTFSRARGIQSQMDRELDKQTERVIQRPPGKMSYTEAMRYEKRVASLKANKALKLRSDTSSLYYKLHM